MDLHGGSSHFNLMEHLGCDIQKHFSRRGGGCCLQPETPVIKSGNRQ